VSLRSRDPSALARTTFRRRVGRYPCPPSRPEAGGSVQPYARYPRFEDPGSALERAASLMNSAPSFIPNLLIWTPPDGNDVSQFGGSAVEAQGHNLALSRSSPKISDSTNVRVGGALEDGSDCWEVVRGRLSIRGRLTMYMQKSCRKSFMSNNLQCSSILVYHRRSHPSTMP
jgi:hypothetical protein